MHKLIIIGPRFNTTDSQIVGGSIVLFEELIFQLKQQNIPYVPIDTNKLNYKNSLLAYISITYQLICHLKGADHISLHSSRDYQILTPLLILFGKVFKKTTSLRKFGGEAKENFMRANFIKKYYLTLIFSHINFLFFETKYLVSFFSHINNNTFWFPNVRNRTIEPTLPRKFNKKFVFISHIIKEKGIDEIIEASRELDESYTIDLYGPLLKGHYTEDDLQGECISYKGVLPINQVLPTLNKYDVVLLPSYKEGYPGIIIEAYSLGIPVIATNLQSICEIVDSHKTGVLIEPKNSSQLLKAIKYFNEKNYVESSQHAYDKFDTFKSEHVVKSFIATIIMLRKNRRYQ